jgi:RNA polymerase sigma-70 factor (ECF subfamily)
MAYLRVARSNPPQPANEHPCVQAFDADLGYIFETLRRLGARPSEVEDLAHEVFVVLYRNWAEIDTSRPLRPYLFGIAFRLVAAHRRRHSRETPYASPEIEDGRPDPERELESRQSVKLLLAALACVPLKRRAVVIMYELDGLPIVEIARTLSISRFGAYARLHKGRTELAAAVRRLQRQTVC